MNEDFFPNASRIFVKSEEGNSVGFQMRHRLSNIRRLQRDMVNPRLSLPQKTVQKTSGPGRRNDLQTGQIAQGINLPEKPGNRIFHAGSRNRPQNVTKKMFGLCLFLILYRDGNMVNA